MKVLESGFGYALCDDRGTQRHIDTMLVGDVSPNDWLLVFIDAAREKISQEDALRISDALSAIEKVMSGAMNADTDMALVDQYFADLVTKPVPS